MTSSTDKEIENMFSENSSEIMKLLRTHYYASEDSYKGVIANMMKDVIFKENNTIDLSVDRAMCAKLWEEYIVSKYPCLSGKNWEEGNKLVIGYIQSGKTELACSVVYLLLLSGKKVCFWQRNSIGEVNDILKKVNKYRVEFKNSFEEWLKGKNINIKNVPELSVVDCSNKSSIVDSFDSGTTFVVGALNNSQISRYIECMKSGIDVVFLFDEADQTSNGLLKSDEELGGSTSVANRVEELKGLCKYRIEITATPRDNLSDEFRCGDLIILEKPAHYKYWKNGVEPIIIDVTVPKIEVSGKLRNMKRSDIYKSMENYLRYDTNFEGIYNDLSLHEGFSKEEYGVDMGVNILHKSFTKKDEQNMLFQYMISHSLYRNIWAVIVENCYGLSFYHHSLGESITLKNTKGKMKEYKIDDDGVFRMKNVSITSLYEWIFHNGGKSRFSHTQTISGNMSGRCKSYCYVPDDPDVEGYMHLTHEYYLVKSMKTSKVANHLQAIRLCNKFPNSIPLLLVTTGTIHKDISTELLTMNIDIQRLLSMDPDRKTSEYMDSLIINENKKFSSLAYAGAKNKSKKIFYSVFEDDYCSNNE